MDCDRYPIVCSLRRSQTLVILSNFKLLYLIVQYYAFRHTSTICCLNTLCFAICICNALQVTSPLFLKRTVLIFSVFLMFFSRSKLKLLFRIVPSFEDCNIYKIRKFRFLNFLFKNFEVNNMSRSFFVFCAQNVWLFF